MRTPVPQQLMKMKGKEALVHMQALLAQMEEMDKEEFFRTAETESFYFGELHQCRLSKSPCLQCQYPRTESNALSIPIQISRKQVKEMLKHLDSSTVEQEENL